MDTTRQLKDKAETSESFRSMLVRCARRQGIDVDLEGPHFRHVIAAERLGRDGWTVDHVLNSAM